MKRFHRLGWTLTAIIGLPVAMVMGFQYKAWVSREMAVRAVTEDATIIHPVIREERPNDLPLSTNDLDSLAMISDLADHVSHVRPRLALYQEWYAALPTLAAGQHVDIVLQTHSTNGADANFLNDVAVHQQLAANVIAELQPTVVAAEGYDGDRVTLSSVFAAVDEEAQSLHLHPTQAQRVAAVQNAIPTECSLLIMRDYPNVYVTGGEDRSLYLLHRDYIRWLDRHGPWGTWPRLHTCLRQLRGMVAMHQLLDAMQRQHSSSGVLVIGYKHGPDLEHLCRQIGLDARIFNTAPDEQ